MWKLALLIYLIPGTLYDWVSNDNTKLGMICNVIDLDYASGYYLALLSV